MSHLSMVLLLAVAWQAEAPRSPEGASANERRTSAQRLDYMKRVMAEYRVFEGKADKEQELTLRREPVCRWSRQITDISDGATFVWTQDGRPQAVTQLFFMAKPRPRWVHMFTSLSERPVRAERDGQTVWAPAKAGAKMRPLPGSPAPAQTAAVRRRQMRSMLEGFEASIMWSGEVRYPLRAVPTPIYRYGDPHSDPLDGAIYALSEGTNPKLLLRLEARRGASAGSWRFAVVPVTVHEAKVAFKGREVFKIPFRREATLQAKDTFFNLIFYVDDK